MSNSAAPGPLEFYKQRFEIENNLTRNILLPYTVLRDAIFTHPTVAEGLVILVGRRPGEGHATVSLSSQQHFMNGAG
jgi:hypothetical protein